MDESSVSRSDAGAGFAGYPAPWLAWWEAAAGTGAEASMPVLAPEKLREFQQLYLTRLGSLWNDFLQHPERTTAPIKDGRFADHAWQESSLYAFLARAYLLNSEMLREMAAAVEAQPKVKARLCFSVSQWIDANAPSNFLAFNPQAQQRLLETRGQSLTAGLHNLLIDLAKGRVSQVDESAFEVGKNVATTEGAVVFENDLIQLIQYKPLTPTVRVRPFLLVPPCINKYYILDLQPENSFIRYCVDRGNTVFIVSWRNPHEDLGKLGWDDYLERGPITAIDVVRRITGAKKINALGFCVGGTLLATAIAVMLARGDDPIASLTLLTSLLDFEDSGILDIFIDEAHVRMREATLGAGGLMPGRDLGNTFASLRANDLIWNYVVNNYLEGQTPPAFDLLYWNSDSTNLPGPMYVWYLRNMYLENNLRVPNRLRCGGQLVDLRRIRVPTYVFAAREDHIVPWRAAYASGAVLRGVPRDRLRFVLGASGHIAGTINPPSKNRRSYWVFDGSNAAGGAAPAQEWDAQHWFDAATEHPGSWWPDWDRWLGDFADGSQAAPGGYGSAEFRVVEPAPGRYVKEKA
ncbi:MAG TPA: class I poly(R)-hydroxyalkanoic acid synthase [Burkholderiaceae bacterium]|nr:class I poly(R)-hydroxyalkanoic acid synthase [Burkholderiaceae bacterium]